MLPTIPTLTSIFVQYISVGCTGDDYDELAKPIGDRLFFAGEATCRKHPATTTGRVNVAIFIVAGCRLVYSSPLFSALFRSTVTLVCNRRFFHWIA